MLPNKTIKLPRLSLEWRYRIGVVSVILFAMLIVQLLISKPAYENDKHSALVNLAVLLFTVLFVEQLASHRASVAVRQADEQRILGFNQMLGVYLNRYLLCAYEMTHPMGSLNKDGDIMEHLLATEFPDMEHMYNISLLKFVPFGVKCYDLYFEAAEELGEVINRSLLYVNSAHYNVVAETLIELASNNNKLYITSLHKSFKLKESMKSGTEPMADSDKNFLQQVRSGAIDQTAEFIESRSHVLNDYALTYRLMIENVNKIKEYYGVIKTIRKGY